MEYEQNYIYKQINSIVFGVFSPKVIKKMASAKIVTPELYDKEGYPVDGGLMDTRLGVIDPGLSCKTCGSRLKECIGHFGYIELARPVIHVKFIDLILTLLRSTCNHCGRVLIPAEKIKSITKHLDEIESQAGLDARRQAIKTVITTLKTINKCPHCNAKQEKISIEKPTTILENEKRLSPIEIRTRLEKIEDDDLILFGINPLTVRPEWFVLTVMPIPPVTMRPSITLESGERSEDDLTHKLGDIVRINQRLFENINAGAPEIIIEDLWDLLQYHITTFFDNNISQIPSACHRNGQPLKTLTERIKSKEGRIRHNLAGKRTNFSARTVISPDPMLDLNEVGVPEVVARKLTVPERVTDWNLEYLKKFINNGPGKYPGANYIARPDGKKKKITDETKEQLLEEIQPGYVVERHLIDGDIAIFNRQPSLHRMSMMAHKVKVLPYLTFRINPAVANPYNADYDGDEMNLHIPQTEESRAEAELLMMVETQLVSPAHGSTIIGCIQGSITGNYLLTRDLKLSRNDAIDLLSSVRVYDYSKLSKKDKVTGLDLVNVLLPNDFDFVGTTKNKEDLIIKNGEILKGYLDASLLGEGEGHLLRTIRQNYGKKFTVDFLGKLFRLGVKALYVYGLSSNLGDIDLPKDASEKVKELYAQAHRDVEVLIKQYKEGTLEELPGKDLEESLELRIMQVLNNSRNEIGNIVSNNANDETGTMLMANSGARGKILNLAQMSVAVGQQAMKGKRIERGFKDRTLSSFKRGDLGAEAHGFVDRGYKQGVTPQQFFFMAMTGRDSLMDTALRTPKSGYLYRRLANALQDVKVEYDHTVRDAAGRIIQFTYGDDGIDVSKSEHGKINVKRVVNTIIGG